MSNKFIRCSLEQSPFRIALKDTVKSNRTLTQWLMLYSLILMILGGQLPVVIVVSFSIISSIALFYYMARYTKLNKSYEHRKTSPIKESIYKKADIVGFTIMTLPFYGVSLLSIIRKSSDSGGAADSMLRFFINCFLILILYSFSYLWAVGKESKVTYTAPLIKLSRLVALIICLAITGGTYYAVNKASSFYFENPELKDMTVSIPAALLDKDRITDHITPDWNKLLIIVTNLGRDGKVNFLDQKVLNKEQAKKYTINFSEFKDAPENFAKIIAEFDGTRISLNNYGKLKTPNIFQRRNSAKDVGTWQKLKKILEGQSTYCFLSSPILEETAKDPWCKRLFSLQKNSLNLYQNTLFIAIPFTEGEPFAKMKVSNLWDKVRTYNHLYYASQRYFRKTLESTSEYSKSRDVTGGGYSGYLRVVQQKFLRPLAGLYVSLIILLLLLCFVVRFKPVWMSTVGIAVVCGLIWCDNSLLTAKLNNIMNGENHPFIRAFSTIDLHNTLIFRNKAEEVLKEYLERDDTLKAAQEDKTSARLYCIMRYAWLNMVDSSVETAYDPNNNVGRLKNGFSSQKGNFYTCKINSDKDNTIVLNHDGFLGYYTFPMKLIRKPGAYYISHYDKIVVNFKDINVTSVMNIDLRYNHERHKKLKRCSELLKENWESKEGQELLNNESIYVSILYHLYSVNDSYSKERKIKLTDSIELSREQQMNYIRDNIKRIQLSRW